MMKKAGIALAVANTRYWTTVAPIVRKRLRAWEQRTQAIRNPRARVLAAAKLREEGFNAEVAATLATLARPTYRARAIDAIVALELLFDYLDGVNESPAYSRLGHGRRLMQALRDAVDPEYGGCWDYYTDHPEFDDDGYSRALVKSVRDAIAGMPAITAVVPTARAAIARCIEAQAHAHATTPASRNELEDWAKRESKDTTLDWREFLAGAASSVLGVHALIAASSRRATTPAEAKAIDTVYLSIAALCTMLDSLVDYREDLEAGLRGYMSHYDNVDHLAHSLSGLAKRVIAGATEVPDGSHHVMTLVGVVAYYSSAPTAVREPARMVMQRLRQELHPAIVPTLAVMRTWRLAKRLAFSRSTNLDHLCLCSK
jgi:tetraprenyl-beta-curcumene synthase